VACTDSRLACRMQPTHDVACRPPGGTHVCCGCASGYGRVHGAQCGLSNWVQHSRLAPLTSRLSTIDPRLCGAQRAHTGRQPAASGQQPAASSQPVDLQSHPQNAAHRLRAAPGPDCARNIRLGLPMAYAGRTKKPLELRLSRLTSSACRLVVVAASAVFPAIRSRGATLGAMRCLPVS
jgi:hypothetical protein